MNSRAETEQNMTDPKPLVSVIVPTYNQEKFVGPALDSVLAQDYPHIEIVVRDDASKDGTPAVIEKYARAYPDRIIALKGEQNLGITGNCNELLKACRGKYIAVFAGDDLFLPGKVSQQVAWFETDEKRVLCHHDVEVFDSDTNKPLYLYSQRHPLRKGSVRELLRYPAFCAGASVMVRASCVPAQGYDGRIPRSSDWLFFLETLLARGLDNPGAGFIPTVLSRYRRHATNVTNAAHHYGPAETMVSLDILQERVPECSTAIRMLRSERAASYGFRAVSRGDWWYGVKLLGQAVAISPWGVARSLLDATRYFSVRLGRR